ncbi:hypothetical protein GIB67_032472, partial [Kingdonia uniflora]
IAWIESDSTTAVEAFKTNSIPWILEASWENARRNMRNMILETGVRLISVWMLSLIRELFFKEACVRLKREDRLFSRKLKFLCRNILDSVDIV